MIRQLDSEPAKRTAPATIDPEHHCDLQLLLLVLRHHCQCHSRRYRHCRGPCLKGCNLRSRRGHRIRVRHCRFCHNRLDWCCHCYCWLCSCSPCGAPCSRQLFYWLRLCFCLRLLVHTRPPRCRHDGGQCAGNHQDPHFCLCFRISRELSALCRHHWYHFSCRESCHHQRPCRPRCHQSHT